MEPDSLAASWTVSILIKTFELFYSTATTSLNKVKLTRMEFSSSSTMSWTLSKEALEQFLEILLVFITICEPGGFVDYLEYWRIIAQETGMCLVRGFYKRDQR